MNSSHSSTKKQYFYLFLVIVGGSATILLWAVPVFIYGASFHAMNFITSTWTSSFYAKSLTIDFWTIIITSIAFIIFEGKRIKMPYYWLYVGISLFLAIALGLPLFLFMRERWLQRVKKNRQSELVTQ